MGVSPYSLAAPVRVERQAGLSVKVPARRILKAAFMSLSKNYLDLFFGCPAQLLQQNLEWESLPSFFLYRDSSPKQTSHISWMS